MVAGECRTQAGDNPDGSGMSLLEVHAALSDLAAASGPGSTERKVTLLAHLLKDVSPLGAKHITRIVVGRLRVGIGDPTRAGRAIAGQSRRQVAAPAARTRL